MTDDNCATCIHAEKAQSGTRCLSRHNQEGGIATSWACKQLGIHKTAEQLREEMTRDAIERNRLIAGIGYESERAGEIRALGVRK